MGDALWIFAGRALGTAPIAPVTAYWDGDPSAAWVSDNWNYMWAASTRLSSLSPPEYVDAYIGGASGTIQITVGARSQVNLNSIHFLAATTLFPTRLWGPAALESLEITNFEVQPNVPPRSTRR